MKHILSVLVENKPGVLSRVTGLISRRGFNIESLSVGPTEDPTMSRVTAIVKADDVAYEQITKQLHKLISVHKSWRSMLPFSRSEMRFWLTPILAATSFCVMRHALRACCSS